MRAAVLDIGGTSIKSGLWNGQQLTEVKERDTQAKTGACHVVSQAVEILKSYLPFDSVGIIYTNIHKLFPATSLFRSLLGLLRLPSSLWLQ